MSTTAMLRVVCVTLLLALAAAVPLQAQGACFVTLAQCFQTSALIESFWFRTWEALDCELAFVGCVRLTIFGL